jgi:UDP-N-acetyl-D-glucosamine dehydrogenase
VLACDPHVPRFETHHGRVGETAALSDELLAACDCAVIITGHSAFPYQRIVELAPVVVDTRNATRHLSAELRARVELL